MMKIVLLLRGTLFFKGVIIIFVVVICDVSNYFKPKLIVE
jgi:hypothetical protein